MEKSNLAPEVVDVVPKDNLYVAYPGGLTVNLGNELTPFQVKDGPVAVEWEIENYAYYTISMLDPDGNNVKGTEVIHWLVGNIYGNDWKNGYNIAEYRGSRPPQGTGLHRYIFLVFKQNGRVHFTEETIPSGTREGRLDFCMKNFVEKYNLGNPVAGNYFLAQFDDYVAQVNANVNKK